MTSELIPAICPMCGGKLQVDPSADTLICQFCNTEHIIRRTVSGTINLEAFARCPLCKRNDQVEKVSAILNKQTSQSDGYTPQQEVYSDSDGHAHSRTVNVPTHTTHKTDLARRLDPPQEPDEPKGGCVWIIFVIAIILSVPVFVCTFMGIAGISFGFSPLFGKESLAQILVFIPPLFCASIAALFILIIMFLVWKYSKKKDEARVIQEKIIFAQKYRDWQQAYSRYVNLYYCGRDDIVFIPGEKTSANVVHMMEYLYTIPRK
jgi:hypothetical protein